MFYVIKFYKLPLKVNLGPPLCINHRIDYDPATPQCIFRLYPAVYIRILYYSVTFMAKWGTHLHDSHGRAPFARICYSQNIAGPSGGAGRGSGEAFPHPSPYAYTSDKNKVNPVMSL